MFDEYLMESWAVLKKDPMFYFIKSYMLVGQIMYQEKTPLTSIYKRPTQALAKNLFHIHYCLYN